MRCIVDQLKEWVSSLPNLYHKNEGREDTFLLESRRLIRSALLSFLERGLQQFGKRISDWVLLSEEIEDNEASFQTIADGSSNRKPDAAVWMDASNVVGSIEQVNSAWRLWGAIGGVVSKIAENVGASGDFESMNGEENDTIGDMYIIELNLVLKELRFIWQASI